MPLFKFPTGRFPPTPPLPDAARFICATRAAPKVPLETFEAFVVSVVALVANAVPLVFVQVIAAVPEVVQSPDRSAFVTEVAPENLARFPDEGEPVVVK